MLQFYVIYICVTKRFFLFCSLHFKIQVIHFFFFLVVTHLKFSLWSPHQILHMLFATTKTKLQPRPLYHLKAFYIVSFSGFCWFGIQSAQMRLFKKAFTTEMLSQALNFLGKKYTTAPMNLEACVYQQRFHDLLYRLWVYPTVNLLNMAYPTWKLYLNKC